jgi:chemotaxis protein methyltransferase WspC
MTRELRGIEGLLASQIGLDPVSVGSPLILQAACQRMKDLGLDDLSAYERRVRQSEPELQALIEEVVVSESWFFRDRQPFQWFREYVQGRWLNDPQRPPLRVLSVPCAAGEEPYSVAMTLWDLGLPPSRFRIDAVDVSERRLAIARRGVYSANAFRGFDLGYRVHYFRQHPQGYELDPAVRGAVQFRQASILDPRLLEGSPAYDVLFCRNLLIYLAPAARARVMGVIDRLLAADGLLFIGHADRLERAGAEEQFMPDGEPGCFAYRRAAHRDACLSQSKIESHRPISSSIVLGSEPRGVASMRPPGGGAIAAEAADPGSATVLASRTDEPPALLAQAAELANQERFGEAIAACEQHLRLKGPAPAAYHLMGMIYQAAGDRRRAEDCFRKTVYLDPAHDEALLALALLAERRGDPAAAAGFRRRTAASKP